jgi:peroxidase
MSTLYTAADLAELRILVGRNADGIGNNVAQPDWGSTDTTYRRVTETSYLEDANGNLTELDTTLPSVKSVSDAIFDLGPDEQSSPHQANHNENVVFFGQLLTHDMVFSSGPNPAAGIPVIPFPDPTFPFGVRNGFVIEDGVAQQINTKTSFLDLSMVYGETQALTDQLTDGGRLILRPDGLLPTLTEIPDGNPARGPFFTGDQRANQTPQLLSQQTIWARNHNWHADQLEAKYGDSWTDEQIFNAARA